MGLERRTVLGGAGAVLGVLASRAEAAVPSPLAKFLGPDRGTVNMLRVTSGDDGNARFEDMVVQPQRLGQGSSLTQFFDRQAHAYAVFSAPPGHVTPERLVLGYAAEFLFLIGGSAAISTRSGTKEIQTGHMVLFEDSKGTGHTVTAGANGYVAIKLLLAARPS